jgi:hypothetical protein
MATNIPDDEWEEVSGESPTRILFDTVGDEFIGTYLGTETIDPGEDGDEPFDVILLRDLDGKPFQASNSYRLMTGLKKVTPGQIVRIRYIKDIPMTGPRNDMKDFTVDVKRT